MTQEKYHCELSRTLNHNISENIWLRYHKSDVKYYSNIRCLQGILLFFKLLKLLFIASFSRYVSQRRPQRRCWQVQECKCFLFCRRKYMTVHLRAFHNCGVSTHFYSQVFTNQSHLSVNLLHLFYVNFISSEIYFSPIPMNRIL